MIITVKKNRFTAHFVIKIRPFYVYISVNEYKRNWSWFLFRFERKKIQKKGSEMCYILCMLQLSCDQFILKSFPDTRRHTYVCSIDTDGNWIHLFFFILWIYMQNHWHIKGVVCSFFSLFPFTKIHSLTIFVP